MSYHTTGLAAPVWPEGCSATDSGCIPSTWLEATPRFMSSVHCSSDKPHGVRTQLPPGGESEEYIRFNEQWLNSHDCQRQTSVTGEVGRDFCCQIGPEIKIPWTLVGIVGGFAAGVYLLKLWSKRQSWQTLEDDSFAEGDA